ncbi:unnamed protein product [Cylicostephanus goldi]|uniref:Uncharacterized protein n=1 Tax=Cylicostephanus goldi TaxID=71465 RepID=A0A3P6U8B4_CYLGO|nr:unnamed protein product [Cylicostephanus goldi]
MVLAVLVDVGNPDRVPYDVPYNEDILVRYIAYKGGLILNLKKLFNAPTSNDYCKGHIETQAAHVVHQDYATRIVDSKA